jgi:peptidoglycan/LPS O-acetylase OafA/YrhL
MVPPAWSVAVEIDMYFMLYLVVARRIEWVLLALFAGLSYRLACAYAGVDWAGYYFTAPGAFLPFATVALLYFLVAQKTPTLNGWIWAMAFVAWLAKWAYPVFLVQWLVGFFIAAILPQDLWLGWTLMLLSAVPITFAAAALAALNNKFVDPLRTKVRDQALVVSDKIVRVPVRHVLGESQL